MRAPGPRPILVVDDDPEAVAMTRRSLQHAGIQAELDVKGDRAAAIGYLRERLARGETWLPLLVFLDLRMPGSDGCAVLDWIRGEPRLRRRLTLVLSTRAAAGARSRFQLAHAMMTVDEVERLGLPGRGPARN